MCIRDSARTHARTLLPDASHSCLPRLFGKSKVPNLGRGEASEGGEGDGNEEQGERAGGAAEEEEEGSEEGEQEQDLVERSTESCNNQTNAVGAEEG
eukprot:8420266-Alexandrium_andersonii.AAC.1